MFGDGRTAHCVMRSTLALLCFATTQAAWLSSTGGSVGTHLRHQPVLASDATTVTKPLLDPTLQTYPSEPWFCTINRDYPGLRALHKEPWIFEVPEFLNEREASELLELCQARMRPSLDSQGERRKEWEFNDLRFDPRRVVGWLEERMARLTGGLTYDCVTDAAVMRYWPGSAGFPPHVDHTYQTCYQGSGRVMTCFIYLSDHESAASEGTDGTHFPELDLVIPPKFGKLVCFFPGALDGDPDPRLVHVGLPTSEEKWLLRFFYHAQPKFPPSNPFYEWDEEGYAVRQVGSFDHESGWLPGAAAPSQA